MHAVFRVRRWRTQTRWLCMLPLWIRRKGSASSFLLNTLALFALFLNKGLLFEWQITTVPSLSGLEKTCLNKSEGPVKARTCQLENSLWVSFLCSCVSLPLPQGSFPPRSLCLLHPVGTEGRNSPPLVQAGRNDVAESAVLSLVAEAASLGHVFPLWGGGPERGDPGLREEAHGMLHLQRDRSPWLPASEEGPGP